MRWLLQVLQLLPPRRRLDGLSRDIMWPTPGKRLGHVWVLLGGLGRSELAINFGTALLSRGACLRSSNAAAPSCLVWRSSCVVLIYDHQPQIGILLSSKSGAFAHAPPPPPPCTTPPAARFFLDAIMDGDWPLRTSHSASLARGLVRLLIPFPSAS